MLSCQNIKLTVFYLLKLETISYVDEFFTETFQNCRFRVPECFENNEYTNYRARRKMRSFNEAVNP